MESHYKYLLIGGGTASKSAIKGIRTKDKTGRIGVLCEENSIPYDRSLLSKELWGRVNLDDTWRDAMEKNVDFHLASKAIILDIEKREVIDQKGDVYFFEKLLLATGSSPREFRDESGKVIFFRNLDDYHSLRRLVGKYDNIAISGGSLLAAELAISISLADNKVTMIFPDRYLLENLFPLKLSRYLKELYEERGIKIINNEKVTWVDSLEEQLLVHTENVDFHAFDVVVACTGTTPRTELAEMAHLEINDGIKVNEFLQTSNPDVYAAGDVANFHNPFLKARLRHEHKDNAIQMGLTAGMNMVGENIIYEHIPVYNSKLFNHSFDAVGDVTTRWSYVSDWKEEFKKGVFYYLSMGQVRGVLLWGMPDKVDAARGLIKQEGPFNSMNLVGKI
ncbi:MAG: NAD(P)/FAD-dependent oxidoreductase [Candidatus Hodarchaeota archaeon]